MDHESPTNVGAGVGQLHRLEIPPKRKLRPPLKPVVSSKKQSTHLHKPLSRAADYACKAPSTARNLIRNVEARDRVAVREHHGARRLVNREIFVEFLVDALLAIFAEDGAEVQWIRGVVAFETRGRADKDGARAARATVARRVLLLHLERRGVREDVVEVLVVVDAKALPMAVERALLVDVEEGDVELLQLDGFVGFGIDKSERKMSCRIIADVYLAELLPDAYEERNGSRRRLRRQ